MQSPLPPADLVYDSFVWHHLYDYEQRDPVDYGFITHRQRGLRTFLEDRNRFQLCLATRDYQPGADSLDSTVDAGRQSASSIFVGSEDLLNDDRSHFALQMCLLRLISNVKFKIIFIYLFWSQDVRGKITTTDAHKSLESVCV